MADPVAVDDIGLPDYEINEDQILRINSAKGVLDNDTDADGDALAASVSSNPKNPLFDFKTNGSFVYDARYHGVLYLDTDGTPTLSDPGDAEVTLTNGFDSLGAGAVIYDTFTYDASDGQTSDEATASIMITGVNDDPIADDDSATVTSGGMISIDVLAGDTDVDIWPTADADNLSVEGLSDIADDGGPAGGSDNDGTDGYSITTDAGGTVSVNPATGEIEYQAADGFFGIDTFEYTVEDPSGGSDTGVVRVTVLPTNLNPDAVDDDRTVNEDAGSTTLATVLGNDTDADDAPLIAAELVDPIGSALRRVDAVGDPAAGPTGTLEDFNADGTFDYNPDGAFNTLGVGDSAYVEFDYIAYDGHGASDQATVTIEITGENDDPTGASPGAVSVYEAGLPGGSKDDPTDTEIPIVQDIDITISDVDASDTPFVAGTTGGDTTTLDGTYGTLEFLDDDTVRYTLLSAADHASVQGHNGGITDTFTVYAVDEHGGSSGPLTVTVNIIDDINFLAAVPVNDDVVFPTLDTLDDISVAFTENNDGTETYTLYSGADGQELSLVGLPEDFTLGDGRTITSSYDVNGNVVGTYVDGDGITQTFYTLTIDPDPDADGETTPVANYKFTVNEGPPTVVNEIDFSAISAGGPQEDPTVENITFNGYFLKNGTPDLTDFLNELNDFPAPNAGEDDINPNNAGGIGIGNGNIERLEVLELDFTASTASITGVQLDVQGVGGGISGSIDLIYVAIDDGAIIDTGSETTSNINVKGGETVTFEPLLEAGEEIDQFFVFIDPADVDGNDKARIN